MSIYLDNAATTYPKPDAVYDAVMHAMREVGTSPGRGGYRRSLEADRIVFRTREIIARLFSIADSSRIIFTHNATAALNLALHGFLSGGDHVVTTSMEHNSLLRPLNALSSCGVEVTIVPAGSEGVVSPDDLRRALRPNTTMVALGHVSNVCGAVQPIGAVGALCRESGIRFLLDAAQSAGSVDIDVAAIGIDLLAVPGHKGLLGPQGTGFLYVAPGIDLKPQLQGGTGTYSSSEHQPAGMPDGFEAGTHNLPGIAGLMAGVSFVIERGPSALLRHEQDLLRDAAAALLSVEGATIYGPREWAQLGNVLSFTVEGIDPASLALELDHGFDIAVRAGLHCAPFAHRTLGTLPCGTVRVSPGWSTTREEIAFFSDAVVQCCEKLR
ncbi:MAG TPA: aminotransferase class V-fold PLP-dependent enzyme [Desulfuromonadales bacterium]|nr:aminotransferase class V-fold PLP-dependent enzyme [Desulfuromonadales bacterium]